ncbi:MAG TPA: hypothetical protein VG144_08940 [Gaiellaceae bacterium]|nr:hypothetical protein [Gaiellaceae bacterium]
MRAPALPLIACLALAGCLHGEEEATRETPAPDGVATLVGEGDVDAAFVVANRLHGVGARPRVLRAAVHAPLVATLAPPALRRGDVVAYNAWGRNRPVIRLHNLETGDDVVLEEGAFSLAWRSDGALATFRGVTRVVDDPRKYVGHVVVRAAPYAPRQAWTRTPGRYVVAAWAGKRLLVYRLRRGWPDLVVLDGPGRVRRLTRAGALVAVSPDGRRAFVATYGASPPVVRVLDVGRGVEVSRLTLRPPVRWLLESGSWTGDLVVATVSGGVAMFRVRQGRIELAQVLRLPPTEIPIALHEPRSADGRRIVGWAEMASRPRQAIASAMLVECDRVALRCVRGVVTSSAAPPRVVYNPSRP